MSRIEWHIQFDPGYLERPNQSNLLKNRVSVRDSARVTIEHLWELICRESNGIISLTFGDLESSRSINEILDMEYLSNGEIYITLCSYP